MHDIKGSSVFSQHCRNKCITLLVNGDEPLYIPYLFCYEQILKNFSILCFIQSKVINIFWFLYKQLFFQSKQIQNSFYLTSQAILHVG